MSKLYKSRQCVEADPCRLEPADVEAFFINNRFIDEVGQDPFVGAENPRDGADPGDSSLNTTDDTRLLEESAASGEAPVDADEAAVVDKTEAASPESGASKTEFEKLFDVAGHIRSLLEAGQQAVNLDSGIANLKSERGSLAKDEEKNSPLQALVADLSPEMVAPEMAPSEVKKGVPKAFSPPKYHTEKGASASAQAVAVNGGGEIEAEMEAEAARERAKQIFSGAQREAGELTEKAKSEAESLLSQAQLQMKQRLDGVEEQAGSILSGARNEAGQITSGASLRAQSLVQEATTQAESIVESAKQKVLLLIENAKKEAEKITDTAQQEAAELKTAAKKEADDCLAAAVEESVNLKNQAHQEGLENGRSEGVVQIRQELEQNLATALALINQAEEERLNRIGSSEPELLKLAVEIAEKIIGAQLKLDPVTQVEITREALTRVATANNILIRVNSEDIQQFKEHSAALQKAFSEPKMIRIEEDPGIIRGNCYIETEHGNIDPRIKSQLEVIWAELLKAGAIS